MTAAGEESTAGATDEALAEQLAAGLAKECGDRPGAAEEAANDLAYLIRKVELAADAAEPNTRRAIVTRACVRLLRATARKLPVQTPDLLRVLAHVSHGATPPAITQQS
jgi:hypothetical protein